MYVINTYYEFMLMSYFVLPKVLHCLLFKCKFKPIHYLGRGQEGSLFFCYRLHHGNISV